VDLELWGCPVNSGQVVTALRDLLSGVSPREEVQPVCMECKRQGVVCVMVSRNEPCMGQVTRAGCGALCPSHGRGCYACYGPAEQVNSRAVNNHFLQIGVPVEDVRLKYGHINSNAPAFKRARDD